jgi:two-component system nitrogen regulation sensor histidine kinase GlnL
VNDMPPEARQLLDSVPSPVLCLAPDDRIVGANQACELFFELSRGLLARRRLKELVPSDSPLLSLVSRVRERGAGVTEYGVEVVTQRAIGERQPGDRPLDIYASPVAAQPNHIIVVLQERAIAAKMSRQVTNRGATRSVSAMSAMLAHEIKNPLSGIRGAAQLLELDADDESRQLTTLIRTEVDRIVRLVDRFDVFSDAHAAPYGPINIHEVLDHVQRLAASGFARDIRFTQDYDPSLPPVDGNWDQLVQVMLNLIKNAAEAIHGHRADGEILVSTAYRPGVRFAVPSSGQHTSLPLEVCVIDNGPGVPDQLMEHLFEPFVTTKTTGSGLGLATVAKIVSDHGGVIECERVRRGTLFRILLPLHRETPSRRGQGIGPDAE